MTLPESKGGAGAGGTASWLFGGLCSIVVCVTLIGDRGSFRAWEGDLPVRFGFGVVCSVYGSEAFSFLLVYPLGTGGSGGVKYVRWGQELALIRSRNGMACVTRAEMVVAVDHVWGGRHLFGCGVGGHGGFGGVFGARWRQPGSRLTDLESVCTRQNRRCCLRGRP